VKKFLEQTYAVLSENDSFFRKVNIHIIQCDDQVQTDQKITCEEELINYMDNLELRGEGGTDFRPAFEYVEKLKKEHRRISGQLSSIAALALGILILIINPISDWIYYGGAIVSMLGIFNSFRDIMYYYNIMATRRLPQFDRTGGDDRA
jgi:hypothetical protein